MKRPTYVCLTGADGTGKTTQAREIVRRCKEAGRRAEYVWARWEPFFLRPVTAFYSWKQGPGRCGGEHFEKAQEAKIDLLRHPLVRRAWCLLSLFDYWVTKRARVARAARRCEVVVLDRYVHDYAVDQALNLQMSPEEMVRDLESRILPRFPKPDITLVLLLPAEEGSRRKADGTGAEYLREREPYYQALLAHGAVGIDASGSVEDVGDAVWRCVEPHVRGEAT